MSTVRLWFRIVLAAWRRHRLADPWDISTCTSSSEIVPPLTIETLERAMKELRADDVLKPEYMTISAAGYDALFGGGRAGLVGDFSGLPVVETSALPDGTWYLIEDKSNHRDCLIVAKDLGERLRAGEDIEDVLGKKDGLRMPLSIAEPRWPDEILEFSENSPRIPKRKEE